MEFQRDRFVISTDPDRMDIDFVYDYLSRQSYWAQGRSREVVEKSIANSLNFGIFDEPDQIGFGRVVTDFATYAWVCDVFIASAYRGRGLGKWLVASIVEYPDLERLKYLVLATNDAHELYRKYGGFEPIHFPERMMIRYRT